MNKKHFIRFVVIGLIFGVLTVNTFAQKEKQPAKLIKSTKFKTETIEFGSGGTISIIGAPEGSIEIEGWNRPEVEITAEIEVQAANEGDLKLLAAVSGFLIEDSMSHISISSVGSNDKKYLKSVNKKFPKRLRDSPFRINYKIKVPSYSDLEIDGGRGDLTLSMVEGVMRIKCLESNANLNLIGGTVQATIGAGDVNVTIASRSWRGRFAEIQVAAGSLNVWLPQNLNANFSAKVLRTGKIDNSYDALKPTRKMPFTDTSIIAKAGNGGAELSFTVGDGLLKIGGSEKIAKK
ncbi:MAG: hypothetical protein KDB79_12055 [Acidobacteria bacterium]|nr:hypothetical protein [Acidobacteriota bacterium]